MVVIRLSRAGAKKRPFYHIVVTDKRSRRDSNYITRIGYFNPLARGSENRLHLEQDKLSYWIGVGAQLSDRVAALAKEHQKSAETSGK
jgi:small subunit ribosomal protein S16